MVAEWKNGRLLEKGRRGVESVDSPKYAALGVSNPITMTACQGRCRRHPVGLARVGMQTKGVISRIAKGRVSYALSAPGGKPCHLHSSPPTHEALNHLASAALCVRGSEPKEPPYRYHLPIFLLVTRVYHSTVTLLQPFHYYD